MSKLVSILIPAYNAEKWIRYTIESALSQTWPRKEIIIVNDGSRDKTFEITKQFESKSVKVISQQNKGASATRNEALRYAQGDYIQWLDADDLLAPNKISEQMKIAETDKSNLILYSSCHGTFYWRQKKASFVPNSLWQDLPPLDWILIRFNKGYWIQPSCWLISRKLAELTGPWNERLSRDDDGEYSIRLVAASEFVKFVPTAVVYYRYGMKGSLSSLRTLKCFASHNLSKNLYVDYLLGAIKNRETVEASAALLNRNINFLHYFSFDDKISQLIEENKKRIRELGLEVKLNPVSKSFKLSRMVLGIKKSAELRDYFWRTNLSIKRRWDQFLWLLEKKNSADRINE